MTPSSRYLTCAGRELHFTDWGPSGGPVVLAWHGLARTGRDMDPLAQHLVGLGYRVLCPDSVGRGLSQWSADPANEYCLRFYAAQARDLLDQLDIQQLHWVGTSMGGAIGTVCAGGLVEPSLQPRIRSLLLNDNAPQLAQSAIERIKAYAGQPPAFDTVRELEGFFRQVYAPYGWLGDAQWRQLTESSVRRLPDGRVTPHYDPAMVQQFVNHPDDYLLWPHYDRIACPVLCLRGEKSDLVLPEVVAEMHMRGPGLAGHLHTVEVPDCGHAPALNVPSHFKWVAEFLRAAERGVADFG